METIEQITENLYLPVCVLLVALGIYLLWLGYRVYFRNRTQLIRFGSGELPGAQLLKSQFATLFALQAIASLSAAITIFALQALQPGIYILMAALLALGLRRGVLISGLEKHAASARSEAS